MNHRTYAPRTGLVLLIFLALFTLPAVARAAYEKVGEFGQEGHGLFTQELGGMALNRTTGNLYVAERGQARVNRFDSEGHFQLSFGAGVVVGGASGSGDINETSEVSNVLTTKKAFEVGQTITGVGIPAGTTIEAVGPGVITLSQATTQQINGVALSVAEGTGNSPLNELQTISLDTRVGTFGLSFTTPEPSPTSASTAPLSASATAAELQASLEGLSNVGSGNVGVSGAAGGPWTVEFKGTRFADTDVDQLTAGNFAAKVGAQLTCTSITAGTASFQWLTNGSPSTGPGATTATYTTVAADAGKAVQCQVFKFNTSGVGSTQVSPATIVAPTPTPLPPTPPGPAIAISGTVTEGSTLTCPTTGWGNSPTSFAFQWYRSGSAIAGATSSTYVITAGDVATAAVFQCRVTATNAGGSAAKVSQNKATTPAPAPAAPPNNTGSPNASVQALNATIATTRIGASAAEVCTALVDCKSGVQVSGNGQFLTPVGVGVDQSSGDVYVLDPAIERSSGLVQNFTAGGSFISSFGERGSASAEQLESPIGEFTGNGFNSLAVGPDGRIYVVDRGLAFGPRVAVYTAAGAYEKSIGVGVFLFGFPQSVALDDAGNTYVATAAAVYKFAPSGTELWSHDELTSGVLGLAVNPETEEVFYSTSLESFVQLDSTGAEITTFPGVAGEESTLALAFNPSLSPPGPARPLGLLYGVDFPLRTGLIFAESMLVPPVVKSEAVTNIGETSATLKATINPENGQTSYRFEYGSLGPCSTNPCTEIPSGGSILGRGKADLTASATLSGLVPGNIYYYRAIATSPGGSAVGPDQTFSTFSSSAPGLPDSRAYEMVSPAEKDGGEVYPPEPRGGSCVLCAPGENQAYMPMQVAPTGAKVAYEGQAFSGMTNAGENEYIGARSSTGWLTTGISDPAFGTGGAQGFKAFSEDLNHGVLAQGSSNAMSSAPPGYANLYLWQTGGGVLPLVSQAPEHRSQGPGANAFSIVFAGANIGLGSGSELTHVIFAANDGLTPAISGIAPAAPDPGAGGEDFDLYEWVGGTLRMVNVLPGNSSAVAGNGVYFGLGGTLGGSPATDHAISNDGSRIFWSDQLGQLYIRVGGTETRKIEDAGRFLTASVTGTKVLLDNGHLYDVDLGPGATVDLTDGEGAFQGMLGASDDLSRIYFVDTKALTPPTEKNANNENAADGAFNLYYWRGGTVSFVGALLEGDNKQSEGFGTWKPQRALRTAQVSEDGRFLAFTSAASLTGYNNAMRGTAKCIANTQEATPEPRCQEVFEYDADSGKLSCASCNPTTERPLGGSMLAVMAHPAAQIVSSPNSLTADGRLFFNSQDVLSPRDVNGKTQDVYQWTPTGVGGCGGSKGCVAMITSGHAERDSYLFGVTPSGNDALFVTRAQLVPRDTDDLLDLYDARVGGGFSEPVAPAPCVVESCKGPTSETPAQEVIPSTTNVPGENLKPPKKKHKPKHKHHKKQKHHKKHQGKAGQGSSGKNRGISK